MRTLAGLLSLVLAAGSAGAGVTTKEIDYEHDGTKFKGFLAYDAAATGKRPGILVVHEWWGLNDYAKQRAKMLALLGYVAFCPDMYGEGKVTEHPDDARKMATTVRMNVQTWRGRAHAALKVLQGQEQVDADKLAAIGYCFGGSTALQLAYSGAPLKAVVTFHAALPTPTPDEAKMIKARILVCHGNDDPFIQQKDIEAFKAALDTAGGKYQFDAYAGAVHSFTVKEADAKGLKGMGYNEAADRKSWEQMQALFKETLGK
jgi:dienelactone hydrolase